MAMGKNSVITIRMELKSDKQVKTFWAVKMLSVKTYVKKVTKVISTVELKKNDKNAPRTKASLRNQESSDLKTNKQTNKQFMVSQRQILEIKILQAKVS